MIEPFISITKRQTKGMSSHLKNLLALSNNNHFRQNLFDASKVEPINRYITSNDGNIGTPSSAGVEWRCTDYIAVTPGVKYYFQEIPASASVAGSAWYDSSKKYISGFSATQLYGASQKMKAPAKAKYLRHSFRIDSGYNSNWEKELAIFAETNNL